MCAQVDGRNGDARARGENSTARSRHKVSRTCVHAYAPRCARRARARSRTPSRSRSSSTRRCRLGLCAQVDEQFCNPSTQEQDSFDLRDSGDWFDEDGRRSLFGLLCDAAGTDPAAAVAAAITEPVPAAPIQGPAVVHQSASAAPTASPLPPTAQPPEHASRAVDSEPPAKRSRKSVQRYDAAIAERGGGGWGTYDLERLGRSASSSADDSASQSSSLLPSPQSESVEP